MSHSNQLIHSKHLLRFPEPLNGLSLWVSQLHISWGRLLTGQSTVISFAFKHINKKIQWKEEMWEELIKS